ncbi:MAG: 50S ribosomal protein L10 [Planctomycetes bacterium]|nr:50S ribosomal protein L10 [Planctomycetota bacterium]
MPSQVNEILVSDLTREFQNMGSCVVVEFGKLQPQQDVEIRTKLREIGVRYRVVRGRLAKRAFSSLKLDLSDALKGRCGVAIAQKEGAIQAAKVLREWIKKTKDAPLSIKGGVVEGTPYSGKLAEAIADLPDRATVNTQIVTAISGPARSLASLVSAVAGGLARCIQARIDKAGSAAAGADQAAG